MARSDTPGHHPKSPQPRTGLPPPNKQPKALDCCQNYSSLSHEVRLPAPPNKPGIARLRTRATEQAPSPNKPISLLTSHFSLPSTSPDKPPHPIRPIRPISPICPHPHLKTVTLLRHAPRHSRPSPLRNSRMPPSTARFQRRPGPAHGPSCLFEHQSPQTSPAPQTPHFQLVKRSRQSGTRTQDQRIKSPLLYRLS